MSVDLARYVPSAYHRFFLEGRFSQFRGLPAWLVFEKVYDDWWPFENNRPGTERCRLHTHDCDKEPTVERLVAYACPFDGLRFINEGAWVKSWPNTWDPYWFEARLVHFKHQQLQGFRDASVAEAVAALVLNPGLKALCFRDPWFSDAVHEVFVHCPRNNRGSWITLIQPCPVPELGPCREWWHHRLLVRDQGPWGVPFPPRNTVCY